MRVQNVGAVALSCRMADDVILFGMFVSVHPLFT